MDRLTHAGGEGTGRFVHLTTVGDLNTARLLAARLAAEGIESRIHGDALGPYPVTVGSMAEVEIWVMSDRVAEASQLLLDAEVNEALAPVDGPAAPSPGVRWRLTAAAVVAVLAVLALYRALAWW